MKRKREIGISITLMQIRVPTMGVMLRIIIRFVALFMRLFYITATRRLLLFTV